jgi:hypothetical protein
MPTKLSVATMRPWTGMGVMAWRTVVMVTSTSWLKTPNSRLTAMSAAILAAEEPRNAGTQSITPSASSAADTSTTP